MPLGIFAVIACGITPGDGGAPDYLRDVRPILADHCFACHGPDAESRRPRREPLRLDLSPVAEGGTALVPGDPTASDVWHRITSTDSALRMPPEGPPLSKEDVETLRQWIEHGAVYADHWAYTAPVDVDAHPHHSIDSFIRATLIEKGGTAANQADSRTLVRRLSFDLTGLPPRPEDVDAFVADPSDEQWRLLVESYLSSPHHAERMATFWFDLVRFANTTGIHADNRWKVDPYRDWVLNAFHSNMPFDQFTMEQLAGDLLPNATQEQRVAAAYNRLNLITREGGSQAKEFLVRYTADRVRNLTEVWLASTVGCAECHDHKFDPISQRDFYQLGAFFADIEQVGVYDQGERNTFAPEFMVASESQSARLVQLDREIAQRTARLEEERDDVVADRSAWEADVQASEAAWRPLVPRSTATKLGTQLAVATGGAILASNASDTDLYTLVFDAPDAHVRGLRLELLRHDSLPQGGPGLASNGNLVLSELTLKSGDDDVTLSHAFASLEQDGYPVSRAIDGTIDRTGWAVLRDGRSRMSTAVFGLDVAPSAKAWTVQIHQQHGTGHLLGRFRLSWTDDVRATSTSALPERVRVALAAEPRSDEQKALLRKYHREHCAVLADERTELAALRETRDALEDDIPRVLETRTTTPMVVRVLPRGDWTNDDGPVVEPGVPSVLGPPLEVEGRPTRLDLARWLTRVDHPLVARVFVNHLWRLCFGAGLVTTGEDFGTQGALPSHPELLDHLAKDFVAHGFDVRHVLRRIVQSNTYRQASDTPEEWEAVDPSNTWLARQSRFRLDAEFVRDQALAASGLLVRTFGGPSVFPYQPKGYWSHLNFPTRTYEASSGDDLYRRTIYSHWQRQYLHPTLLAFDASPRERCVAQRNRSNTPLAALASLNDPVFVEAARTLATRLVRDVAPDERLDEAFRLVLQRRPSDSERGVLDRLVANHLTTYQAAPDEARRLISIGESPPPTEDVCACAAWTSAVRVLLNLHETITRH